MSTTLHVVTENTTNESLINDQPWWPTVVFEFPCIAQCLSGTRYDKEEIKNVLRNMCTECFNEELIKGGDYVWKQINNPVANINKTKPKEKSESKNSINSISTTTNKTTETDKKPTKNSVAIYKSEQVLQRQIALTVVYGYFLLSFFIIALILFVSMNNIQMPDWGIGLIGTIIGAVAAKMNDIVGYLFGSSVQDRSQSRTLHDVVTEKEKSKEQEPNSLSASNTPFLN